MTHPILAHLGRALIAAVAGSTAATAIVVPLFLPTRMMIELRMPVDSTAAITLMIVSLFFTLPSVLLLAAPIVWPLRDWILRRPWLAGLAYGAIGGLAGCAISLILDGGREDPRGLIGATYGAATGAAFVLMHYWTSTPPPETPEYERIFE